ncbi:hypothetical protein [Sorangium sp. So ce233]|uniref:hypothetical protein n=1 Tax=Sorangium sp. So ce233 TaxID=3133290 RepID=UPI003F62E7BF
MRAALAICAAVLLLAASASAQEKRERRWSVEAGATYVALGDQRPTGGWAPTIAARRWWPAAQRARVSAGIGAAAFGFSSLHWLGFLAGPEVGGDYRLSESWRAGGTLAADMGRVPVVTNWGYPMRYWGLFPRVQIGATYEPSPGVSMSAGLGARHVNTLAWEGVSWEPAARASFGW